MTSDARKVLDHPFPSGRRAGAATIKRYLANNNPPFDHSPVPSIVNPSSACTSARRELLRLLILAWATHLIRFCLAPVQWRLDATFSSARRAPAATNFSCSYSRPLLQRKTMHSYLSLPKVVFPFRWPPIQPAASTVINSTSSQFSSSSVLSRVLDRGRGSNSCLAHAEKWYYPSLWSS